MGNFFEVPCIFMKAAFGHQDDTIVAPATAAGIAAIALIRLSGPEAFQIADALFSGKKPSQQPSHTLHYGKIQEKGMDIDEVVLGLFRGPHSYTGEDIVEISCHGSPFIVQRILEACTAQGARMARPGEFTMRAFLHGKLDLTQAEAVADLIHSQSEAARRSAIHHMKGGFRHRLSAMREQLIRFSALIELELDFSQEDVEFADRRQLRQLLNELDGACMDLLQSFRLGNAIRQGIQVAIIGKPNAGKSTLLNALLQEDRALVSDMEGTTRDTVEETLNLHGVHFRLIDTAGIRQHASDRIEQMGIQRSLDKMEQADLVLYVFDLASNRPHDIQDIIQDLESRSKNYLLIANKLDACEHPDRIRSSFAGLDQRMLFLSAHSASDIRTLEDRMFETTLEKLPQQENTLVTNARHFAALEQVKASLDTIRKGLDSQLPGDLLALDIRNCLYHLGEITGEITHEDQLDYIFSKFCIGK